MSFDVEFLKTVQNQFRDLHQGEDGLRDILGGRGFFLL